MAVELHDLAQVGHHLVAPAVVGNFQQAHVKTLVDFKKALTVHLLRSGSVFELFMQRLQFAHLCIVSALCHNACGIGLKQAQQVVDVGQVTLGDFGHIGATAHLHRHQALGGQHLEGFAHGRAADAVVVRDLEFVDPAAGLQFTVENALTQQFGHFFVKCTGS